jgi:hypothetical protein
VRGRIRETAAMPANNVALAELLTCREPVRKPLHNHRQPCVRLRQWGQCGLFSKDPTWLPLPNSSRRISVSAVSPGRPNASSFTLAALIVYRLGTYIPIPGVDASVMAEMMQRPGGGITVRRWTASREVLNTRPRWP